jgi:hypothetical protein
MFLNSYPPPNNSMDVRRKQRLCLLACLLKSNGLGGGFRPRHLSRSVSSLIIRVYKIGVKFMFNLTRKFAVSILISTNFLIVNACAVNNDKIKINDEPNLGDTRTEFASQHSWTKVTDSAAFPGAYNFPVFVVRNQMRAFHPQGNWYSTDGKIWTKSDLPPAGLNSGYQKYVQFGDAVYALGTMTGDYTNLHLSSRVVKTIDFKRWETVAERSELPDRVFYGATVFGGRIWLLGGFDGKNYYNDVWSSSDAAHWTRVAATTEWSPRNIRSTVVFKNRIWIIGGGVIDG